jgi:hypothetical protein
MTDFLCRSWSSLLYWCCGFDVGIINECGAVDGRELAGETEVLGENPLQWYYPPQIPHDMSWAPTVAAAVGRTWPPLSSVSCRKDEAHRKAHGARNFFPRRVLKVRGDKIPYDWMLGELQALLAPSTTLVSQSEGKLLFPFLLVWHFESHTTVY